MWKRFLSILQKSEDAGSSQAAPELTEVAGPKTLVAIEKLQDPLTKIPPVIGTTVKILDEDKIGKTKILITQDDIDQYTAIKLQLSELEEIIEAVSDADHELITISIYRSRAADIVFTCNSDDISDRNFDISEGNGQLSSNTIERICRVLIEELEGDSHALLLQLQDFSFQLDI